MSRRQSTRAMTILCALLLIGCGKHDDPSQKPFTGSNAPATNPQGSDNPKPQPQPKPKESAKEAAAKASERAPTKADFIKTLQSLATALDQQDSAAAIVHMLPPTRSVRGDLESKLTALARREGLTSANVTKLVAKGRYGKVTEIFKHAEKRTKRLGLDSDRCWGLGHGRAVVMGHWEGDRFRFFRIDDLDQVDAVLPAADITEANTTGPGAGTKGGVKSDSDDNTPHSAAKVVPKKPVSTAEIQKIRDTICACQDAACSRNLMGALLSLRGRGPVDAEASNRLIGEAMLCASRHKAQMSPAAP